MKRRSFFLKLFGGAAVGVGAALWQHAPDELTELDQAMMDGFPTSLLIQRDGAYFCYDYKTGTLKHLFTPMSSIECREMLGKRLKHYESCPVLRLATSAGTSLSSS